MFREIKDSPNKSFGFSFREIKDSPNKSKGFSFRQGLKIFGNDYGSELFNIYLVSDGVRKATLFENYNIGFTNSKNKKFKKWIINNYNIEWDKDTNLIYNTNLVTRREIKEAGNNCTKMGEILGFHCAGELGEVDRTHVLKFYIILTSNRSFFNFYSEMCIEPPDTKFIKDSMKKYKKAAKDLNPSFDVIFTTEYWPSTTEWLNANVDFIFENKKALANLFWNYEFYDTEKFILNIKNKKQITKYIKIWKFIIELIRLDIIIFTKEITKNLENYLNVS